VRQPERMNPATTSFDLPLTDEERYLLVQGLVDWDQIGPARATDAIAKAIGFSSADDLCEAGQALANAIQASQPLSGPEWVRALAAAEIAFASDVLGTGPEEWTIINGGAEVHWF
jgi:hypothetical protein